MNRDACIDCPAGEARAVLLQVGEAQCPVMTKNGRCPERPEDGRMYCSKHRFHVGTVRPSTWKSSGIIKDPTFPQTEAPVARKKKATKHRTVKEGRPSRAKAHQPRPPCVSCGAMMSRPYKSKWGCSEWCHNCVKTALSRMGRRKMDRTPENVRTFLETPSEQAKPPASALGECLRCGAIRFRKSGGRPETTSWCADCVHYGRRTLCKKIENPTGAQIAEALANAPKKKETGMKFSGKGINWDAEPLGIERPSIIARRLGVTSTAVRHAMRKRGITYVQPDDDAPAVGFGSQPVAELAEVEPVVEAPPVEPPHAQVVEHAMPVTPQLPEWVIEVDPPSSPVEAALEILLGALPDLRSKAETARKVAEHARRELDAAESAVLSLSALRV